MQTTNRVNGHVKSVIKSAIGWDDLQTVLAIGRAGSLAGAARALGVNHSTIFRRLNALEDRLGAHLFDRLASGYRLTPEGEDMMDAAARVEDEVAAVERRITGREESLSGTVRLTVADTVATTFLAPHLKDFHRLYPGIQLEMSMSNEFFNISKREADVAVRPTNNPPEALVGRRIVTASQAIYGARDVHGPVRDLAALSSYEWVEADDSLAHIPAVRWRRQHLPGANIVYRADSLLALRDGIAADIGVGMLPCFMADPDPRLERVTPLIAETETDIWLLTHEDLRRSARVRALMDFLAEKFTGNKALFAGGQT